MPTGWVEGQQLIELQESHVVFVLFAGEASKQRDENCVAVSEGLTVPKDAERPTVDSPANQSPGSQCKYLQPALPPFPSEQEEGNKMGMELIKLAQGQVTSEADGISREQPTEMQRNEPGPTSPGDTNSGELLTCCSDIPECSQPAVEAAPPEDSLRHLEGGGT